MQQKPRKSLDYTGLEIVLLQCFKKNLGWISLSCSGLHIGKTRIAQCGYHTCELLTANVHARTKQIGSWQGCRAQSVNSFELTCEGRRHPSLPRFQHRQIRLRHPQALGSLRFCPFAPISSDSQCLWLHSISYDDSNSITLFVIIKLVYLTDYRRARLDGPKRGLPRPVAS